MKKNGEQTSCQRFFPTGRKTPPTSSGTVCGYACIAPAKGDTFTRCGGGMWSAATCRQYLEQTENILKIWRHAP